jgi:hypothetical protein
MRSQPTFPYEPGAWEERVEHGAHLREGWCAGCGRWVSTTDESVIRFSYEVKCEPSGDGWFSVEEAE